MRTYSPPIFNVECRVWHHALPSDISTWTPGVPPGEPDIISVCQKYVPRYREFGENHSDLTNILKTLLETGFVELRVPFGLPIYAPWGVDGTVGWDALDVVEVPSFSALLYIVCQVDDRHRGFPNQYTAAILSQL